MRVASHTRRGFFVSLPTGGHGARATHRLAIKFYIFQRARVSRIQCERERAGKVKKANKFADKFQNYFSLAYHHKHANITLETLFSSREGRNLPGITSRNVTDVSVSSSEISP